MLNGRLAQANAFQKRLATTSKTAHRLTAMRSFSTTEKEEVVPTQEKPKLKATAKSGFKMPRLKKGE